MTKRKLSLRWYWVSIKRRSEIGTAAPGFGLITLPDSIRFHMPLGQRRGIRQPIEAYATMIQAIYVPAVQKNNGRDLITKPLNIAEFNDSGPAADGLGLTFFVKRGSQKGHDDPRA